jgi:hypothetical protein
MWKYLYNKSAKLEKINNNLGVLKFPNEKYVYVSYVNGRYLKYLVKDFDLKFIASHKGGILAANKLQSYGCNALYRDLAIYPSPPVINMFISIFLCMKSCLYEYFEYQNYLALHSYLDNIF